MNISVDPDIFSAFAFYAAILALKMAIMAPLTAIQRVKKGASFWNILLFYNK